jgi:hypothetical protein
MGIRWESTKLALTTDRGLAAYIMRHTRRDPRKSETAKKNTMEKVASDTRKGEHEDVVADLKAAFKIEITEFKSFNQDVIRLIELVKREFERLKSIYTNAQGTHDQEAQRAAGEDLRAIKKMLDEWFTQVQGLEEGGRISSSMTADEPTLLGEASHVASILRRYASRVKRDEKRLGKDVGSKKPNKKSEQVDIGRLKEDLAYALKLQRKIFNDAEYAELKMAERENLVDEEMMRKLASLNFPPEEMELLRRERGKVHEAMREGYRMTRAELNVMIKWLSGAIRS